MAVENRETFKRQDGESRHDGDVVFTGPRKGDDRPFQTTMSALVGRRPVCSGTVGIVMCKDGQVV
jgi:hypothetical protein